MVRFDAGAIDDAQPAATEMETARTRQPRLRSRSPSNVHAIQLVRTNRWPCMPFVFDVRHQHSTIERNGIRRYCFVPLKVA